MAKNELIDIRAAAKEIEAGKKAKEAQLTAKQEMFVREYLIDLNATQAAIRAGYSEKSAMEQGYQLLQKTPVKAAIQAGMDRRARDVEITSTYVLKTIKDTIERCAQAEPVYDKEGNPTGEYKFDSTAVLRGAELLGKHLKLFTDKIEVDVGEALAQRMKEARERTQ